MTSKKRQDIIAAIKRISGKFHLNSGNCGVFAVALNKIFGGKGKYIAVVEEYEPEYISHVALKYNNTLFDGNGVTTLKDMKSYGFNEKHPKQHISFMEVDEYTVLKWTNPDISVSKMELELRKETKRVV